MKVIFPQTQTKDWVQQNKGDLYPVLYSTRNINLEKRGYIGLSRRMSYIKKDAGMTGMVSSIVSKATAQKYKAVSSNGNMYNINQSLTAVTQDTDAVNLNQNTDQIIFNDNFWYASSTGTNMYYRSAFSEGPYTTLSAGLSAATLHPMAVLQSKALLCVADGNVVRTIDTSNAVAVGVTLPTEYQILWMRYKDNVMYIGTANTYGNNAAVFTWSGASALFQNACEINARASVCGDLYDESIVTLSSRGELLRYNGSGGFTQLAVLPFFENKDYSWAIDSSLYTYQTLSRAMSVVDEYLYIALQNGLIMNDAMTALPEFIAGYYQYHKDFGLVHKFSPSQSVFNTITDYGQMYSDTPMSILRLQEDSVSFPSSPVLDAGSRFLVGATLVNPSLTDSVYLESVTSGESRGDFVTSKIYTGDITNVDQTLFIKFKDVSAVSDRIVVKYRSIDKSNYPIVLPPIGAYAITWTSNTTFTTTNSLFANVVSGEEVTVLSGNGAGSLAHISTITNLAGTYTVTLDEAITSVVNGNQAGIIVDNWTKIDTIDNTNTDGFQETRIGINGKYIQLKIEFRGVSEPAIEEITLLSQLERPAK